jgi:hypothetical protein
VYRPFWARPAKLGEFWHVVEEHVRAAQSCAIIGYENKNGVSHWTGVRDATPRTLLLFDSSGVKQLRRAQCRAWDDDAKESTHPNAIDSVATFLLRAGSDGFSRLTVVAEGRVLGLRVLTVP